MHTLRGLWKRWPAALWRMLRHSNAGQLWPIVAWKLLTLTIKTIVPHSFKLKLPSLRLNINTISRAPSTPMRLQHLHCSLIHNTPVMTLLAPMMYCESLTDVFDKDAMLVSTVFPSGAESYEPATLLSGVAVACVHCRQVALQSMQ